MHFVGASSAVLSLVADHEAVRMLCVQADISNTLFGDGIPVILHKYDEIINGREYHIEVSSVGTNQWRANIKRTPGGSAALMPFYGKTPDEAARLLSHWLSIAHGQERTRL
jgi:hypothetical protein